MCAKSSTHSDQAKHPDWPFTLSLEYKTMNINVLKINSLKQTMKGILILFTLHTPLSFAESPELTKETFEQLMIDQMPNTLCSKEQHFGYCTSFSNDICKNVISIAVKECFKKYDLEIPEILNEKSMMKWSGYIGHCIASKTEDKLDTKSRPECKDYQTWKQRK